MKRVVVVGAGFGGLKATADLDHIFRGDPGVEIVHIGGQKYLSFTPLLPQIASSHTDPRHIVQAVREIRGKRKFRFHPGGHRPRYTACRARRNPAGTHCRAECKAFVAT